MIAVIFEVWPVEGRTQTYLDLAGELRRELEAMDGFMSVKRFKSLHEPGKMLSLSFWRDEDAVTAWRNHARHRLCCHDGLWQLRENPYSARCPVVDQHESVTPAPIAPKPLNI